MHNYEKNIHIGDVESKRRAVNGEDEVQEICEVVEEKWDSYENCFVKMWISVVKSVSTKDICTRDENIATCETKPLLK